MKTLFTYLKYIGLFFLNLIIIAIITSLLNLADLNLNKLAIILSAISFFIIPALASHNSTSKGYILGLKLSLIFVFLLIVINLIFFRSSLYIDRIIYYLILIASGILGGSFGKNFKIKKFAR